MFANSVLCRASAALLTRLTARPNYSATQHLRAKHVIRLAHDLVGELLFCAILVRDRGGTGAVPRSGESGSIFTAVDSMT